MSTSARWLWVATVLLLLSIATATKGADRDVVGTKATAKAKGVEGGRRLLISVIYPVGTKATAKASAKAKGVEGGRRLLDAIGALTKAGTKASTKGRNLLLFHALDGTPRGTKAPAVQGAVADGLAGRKLLEGGGRGGGGRGGVSGTGSGTGSRHL